MITLQWDWRTVEKKIASENLSHTTDIARGHLPLLWLFVLSNSAPLNMQFPEAIQ